MARQSMSHLAQTSSFTAIALCRLRCQATGRRRGTAIYTFQCIFAITMLWVLWLWHEEDCHTESHTRHKAGSGASLPADRGARQLGDAGAQLAHLHQLPIPLLHHGALGGSQTALVPRDLPHKHMMERGRLDFSALCRSRCQATGRRRGTATPSTPISSTPFPSQRPGCQRRTQLAATGEASRLQTPCRETGKLLIMMQLGPVASQPAQACQAQVLICMTTSDTVCTAS